MQKQPLKENYKHDDSSTNQKQLSREEKLRLWLEAK